MLVQPYLFFDGRLDEALEFYKKALGAEVKMLMRYKDNPTPNAEGCNGAAPSVAPDKVMHCSFQVGQTELMASDGFCAGKPKFDGFSLSITAPDVAKAEQIFAALSEGGQVMQPLESTFFSERFGMVADKFGLGWMVLVEPK